MNHEIAFAQHLSANNPDTPLDTDILIVEYQRPFTPDSEPSSPHRDSPELISRPHDYHDVDYDDERPHQTQSKKGGYESRVEQLLWESPEPIQITHAGKNSESGGGYIVYTIQTGVWRILRPNTQD
jgi:hypothetical protein